MADKSVTVRLPEEMVAQIRQIAARSRKTLTDVIEERLDESIRAEGAPMKNSERLAAFIGVCDGPVTDVTKLSLGEILNERYERDGHL